MSSPRHVDNHVSTVRSQQNQSTADTSPKDNPVGVASLRSLTPFGTAADKGPEHSWELLRPIRGNGLARK